MEVTEIKSSKDEQRSDLQQNNADDDTFVFEYLGSKLDGLKELNESFMKW
jgi:hypothetical protein